MEVPGGEVLEPDTYDEEEFEEIEESLKSKVFDTGCLIAYYDCPYNITINVGENFSRVEILNYNNECDIFKYSGCQSWLKVKKGPVSEWIEFEEGADSIWHVYTQDKYFYRKDDPMILQMSLITFIQVKILLLSTTSMKGQKQE